MHIQIVEITAYTPAVGEQFIRLMQELSTHSTCTEETLRAVVDDPHCHQYCVLDDDRIVGCATLCVSCSPTGTKGYVEDVVVTSDYRGRHLGRQLMHHLLEAAKQYAPIELHLTSRPSRQAANNLYASLGFERKETNCYRRMLRPDAEQVG